MPPEEREIIVVDNASVDETKQLVMERLESVQNLRYLYEPRLGLYLARETGWRNATGRYVAYIDDDAIACRDWLASIVEAFENTNPRPGAVGGRIDLAWERSPPEWLTEDLQMPLARVDWPGGAHWLGKDEWLAGCNIAFSRDVLERAGGFSEALGRRGNILLSNEDIMMLRKIEKQGRGAFYQPAARVQHFVPASRMDHKWFLRRSFWQGVSDALMDIELTRPSYLKGIAKGWKQAQGEGLCIKKILGFLRTHSTASCVSENYYTVQQVGRIFGYLARRI